MPGVCQVHSYLVGAPCDRATCHQASALHTLQQGHISCRAWLATLRRSHSHCCIRSYRQDLHMSAAAQQFATGRVNSEQERHTWCQYKSHGAEQHAGGYVSAYPACEYAAQHPQLIASENHSAVHGLPGRVPAQTPIYTVQQTQHRARYSAPQNWQPVPTSIWVIAGWPCPSVLATRATKMSGCWSMCASTVQASWHGTPTHRAR